MVFTNSRYFFFLSVGQVFVNTCFFLSSGEFSKLPVPNYLALKVIVTESVLKVCVMILMYTKQIVIHLRNSGNFQCNDIFLNYLA